MDCSHSELVQVLLASQGAQPISFCARTDARALAKDRAKNPNPFTRPIWKIATVNAMVNFWYDRGVLRRLVKEGKSPSMFRRGTSWHEPVLAAGRLTPLCRGKNKDESILYLRVIYLATLAMSFEDANRAALAPADVAPFLPSRSEYLNQGLDCPLRFKTYRIDGIRTLTLRGQTYRLV